MAEALPISGHIDPKAFPLLLIDLHRQAATGSLKVDGPTHQKALYFRNGRILFGSSNDPRDQLGAILVESGKITAEQLEDVNRKVGPGNPLAKALSDSGIVSQRELSEAARAKVERIVSDVFSYTSGTFDFEDGVLPKGAVDLKLPTERLFVSAVRRIGDRAFVLRHLDSLDIVLAPKPDLASALPEIESETGALPDRLDGQRSLREAAASAGMDEFEAAKVGCALLFLGLVEPSAASSEETASPFESPPETEDAEIGFDEGPATLPFGGGDSDSTLVVEAGEIGVSAAPAQPTPPESVAETPASGSQQAAPLRSLSELIVPPPQRGGGDSMRAAAAKPSKADLAALDSLLNATPVEGPLTPLQKSSEPEWHPQFLPEPKRGAKRKPEPSRPGWIPGAGIAAVVLLAGAGAYLWFSGFFEPATPVAAVAPATATPASTSPTTLPASAGASPIAAASPATGAAAPPSAVTPATTRPSPTPAPTAATRPATPAPRQAAASPPPPAATTRSAPAPAGGTATLASSRAFLRGGRHAEAAGAFATVLKPAKGSFTIQLLVACADETVQKAVANAVADELFILPARYNGRDCYRLCWGVYDNRTRASGAIKSVPAYFLDGGAKPRVVTTESVVP